MDRYTVSAMKRELFILKRQLGQGLIEFAVIIALVAITSVVVISKVGTKVADLNTSIADQLVLPAGESGPLSLLSGFGMASDWKNYQGNGSWTLDNGTLCTSGDSKIINQAAMPKDYRISLNNAKLTSGNGYGVMFRLEKSGYAYSGYGFMVDPGLNNQFVFRKYNFNGIEQAPLSTAKFPAGFDKYAQHKVDVVVQGDTFTAYVDGNQVLTAKDSSYASGQVGLRSIINAKACFNGFSVTTP